MNIKIETVVVLTIFILLTFMAYTAEKRDNTCRDALEDCGSDMGRAYANFAPEPGDSQATLKEKLSLTANSYSNVIQWRKIFISSVISTLLSNIALNNRIPTSREFLIGFVFSFVIGYVVVYLNSKWINEPISRQHAEILSKIR